MKDVGKYFDTWAEFTPELKDLPYFAKWLFERIIEEINTEDNKVILDLGTGAGVLLRRIMVENSKMKFIGIDVSKAMLEKAKGLMKSANTEFILGSMDNIELPDASVDYIVSNQAVHHVKDKMKLLREAYRVLKIGGKVIVSDHFKPEDHNQTRDVAKSENKEASEFAKSYLACWDELTNEQKEEHPPEFHVYPEELAKTMKEVGFKSKIIKSPIKCMAIVVGEK